MATRIVCAILTASMIAVAPAGAASVSVTIDDSSGNPARDAVIELVPDNIATLPPTHVPAEGIIDQRHEMFIPLVTVVRKGGQVIFTNNDTTMHQVYSFSSIKQFEFEIDQGHRSQPVVFDKAGIASIGCNIHDQMITYVYVAETPWTARTDDKGHATLMDVPSGAYHAHVWHPQLMPGHAPPSVAMNVAGQITPLALNIPLMAGMAPGMKHMHMGNY